MTTLTAQKVIDAIMKWPGLYQTESGISFLGMPVSQVPSQLVGCGWRNVSGLRESDLQQLGLEIATARYIGGARAKRFCRVVVAGYPKPAHDAPAQSPKHSTPTS